jgi:carbamoyltransferase
MIVVGVSRVHNSSVSLIVDGELVFHVDNERLSNIKYDRYPFLALSLIKDYVDHVDVIAISGVNGLVPIESFDDLDAYTTFVKGLGKTFYNHPLKVYDYGYNHHLMHASCAFYNSGFTKAACLIKDGMGSESVLKDKRFIKGTFGRENMSVFTAEYPNKFLTVYREVSVPFKTPPIFVDNTMVVNALSEGMAFQKTSEAFGFHSLDAGKVMGMSSYGKEKYKNMYKDNGINNDIFTINGSLLDTSLNMEFTDFQDQADFAYALQKETQENVLQEILEVRELTGMNNICLSGGYFLNCVANYYFKKNLPKDINIYVEPISSDSGTALGAAKLAWHTESQSLEVKEQKTIYYGPTPTTYTKSMGKNTTIGEVASLLAEGKIVAIYQGRSEAGPRALGNRSILFDPRVKDGKDIINGVKHREWFRPFAGSVLKEYAHEWFDLAGLEESPFMMYAVDVLKDKAEQIPSIVHVDGTCRVQTVTKEQNLNYYNLIEAFYKITNIPILFNTSFNLAGDCIVETIEDAKRTLTNSKIDYLYLPETNQLLKNQQDI